jgi:hypothetical protein
MSSEELFCLGINYFKCGGRMTNSGRKKHVNGGGTCSGATDATPTSCTLTVTSSSHELSCTDADGCNWAIGETNAERGQLLTVVNIGTNSVTISDTAGVTETAGSFVMGQYDSITFRYISDRWVETARSNN